jgi:prepilin-type N-terminal cleavage/methylation domain-containing protein
MKFFDIQISKRTQKGFTLIETIVSLAAVGFLSAGIAIAIIQINNVNAIGNAQVIAINQVENAIHNLNRDAQMAQSVSTHSGNTFPLTLEWISWESNAENQIVYSLDSDGNLIREYTINEGAPSTKTVAQYISTSSTNTNCSWDSAHHKLTVKLTAIASSGFKEVIETRQIQIIPRPGS